ncbi:winged helix-turn-helix domain-containing protein [Pokkaliibacter sp. MBI-7]|uniref:ATP-binding protein n=1 Tax=Pokkaliibacter sp. MBI-7 TaxID=3040600 RepID=UPI0024480EA4|nr:winged helix-turn-helix domain-containing protein [Pokkaliibacter sp. MBI-7]MDH2434070.1 winged helix-turn-helix domain-containing protein [Pokkaliibacter sp. MBI-7]
MNSCHSPLPPPTAVTEPYPRQEQAVCFGAYRIYPQQRLVFDGERPLTLGKRALDILLVLLQHAGEVVSKKQLLATVWPDSSVEEISLRVHIAALRKALGDGQRGQRYIVTVPQRGYCLAVNIISETPSGTALRREQEHNLPPRLTRMLGRDDVLHRLLTLTPQQRLVSVVGIGGIGKTTVALRTAELLLGQFAQGIRLLDLAPLRDESAISMVLSKVLELPATHGDPLPQLYQHLQNRHMLLVVDNCEHLIDDIAALADSLLRHAPHLHLLCTSREPLNIEGEQVIRLNALAYPTTQMAEPHTVLNFPAIQLFVERAQGCAGHFAPDAQELALVVQICQRLDGIPLAIELAAAHLSSIGLRDLLFQLQNSFRLLTQGRRTALPRHQTLRATLDWSYELLCEQAQQSLRRLSIFEGRFTLESAIAVAPWGPLSASQLLPAIAELVNKSLLNVDNSHLTLRYYLLATTRCYARGQLQQVQEDDLAALHHANFCLLQMKRARKQWEQQSDPGWRQQCEAQLNELRAAMNWALDRPLHHALAISLILESSPLWQELSLLQEYSRYLQQALSCETAARSAELTMQLQLLLGSAWFHCRGDTLETWAAFTAAHHLAEQCQHRMGQLQAISGQMTINLSRSDYRAGLQQGQQFEKLNWQREPVVWITSRRLQALALHYAGQQRQARQLLDSIGSQLPDQHAPCYVTHNLGVQYDLHVATLTLQARILWLQGLTEQACQVATLALERATRIDHATSICYTLCMAGFVIAFHNGKHPLAIQRLTLLAQLTHRHTVVFFQNWVPYYQRLYLPLVDSHGPYPQPPQPPATMIGEFIATLRASFASPALLERAERGLTGWATAELLRVKADHLLSQPAADADTAEQVLTRALQIAREQGALIWELRSATSLAELWHSQGRQADAYELLAPVYGKFSEGFATPDMLRVGALLQQWQPLTSH